MRDLYLLAALLIFGFIALTMRISRPTIDYQKALTSSTQDKDSLSYAFAKALQAKKDQENERKKASTNP